MKPSKYLPLTQKKNIYTIIGVTLVVLLTLTTGYMAQFDVVEAVKSIPGIIGFVINDFFPPSIGSVSGFLPSLLDTFCMAIVATVVAAFVSLILALLCAAPITPHPGFKIGIRALASLLRNIPSLAWVIVLVPAFGIGKVVGLLALTLDSIGQLTRLFTESIEEIDKGGIEAIRSVGGSYWQMIKSGVLPQCFPSLVGWTLYSLEVNVRASTIIGMVGGGGIGFYIQASIKLFRYSNATTAIIAVALIVVTIEYITKKVREQLA